MAGQMIGDLTARFDAVLFGIKFDVECEYEYEPAYGGGPMDGPVATVTRIRLMGVYGDKNSWYQMPSTILSADHLSEAELDSLEARCAAGHDERGESE